MFTTTHGASHATRWPRSQPLLLIAEHHTPARAFLADNFIADGYDVVPAADYDGAVRALLGTRQIDAMLVDLVEHRQRAFTQRTGQPMGPGHVWLSQGRREHEALKAIIARLNQPDLSGHAIRGAGTSARTD